MSRVFKAPKSWNCKTGNVSLSLSESDDIRVGDVVAVISPTGKVRSVVVEAWMVGNKKYMGSYVLMPIAEYSWLCK